ncbi:MAG: hypothetical protein J5929_01220 [Eubacterium sp.]|nr:hypothetical protein [Eubacterium sp.]
MIKYVFTKSELKTLFYFSQHGDYNCELFDVMQLEQTEFNEAEDGLIAKNVIQRINNQDVKVDKMFNALIEAVVTAEYICKMDRVLAFVGTEEQGGIVIVFEEDIRNSEIIKVIPFKNIEEAVEEYGTDLLMFS